MKQISLICFSLMAVAAMFALPSCTKDSEGTPAPAQDLWKFDATLSGTQEVPANTSTATGKATGTYEANSNLLTYNVTWSGLSGTATGGHFHSPALAGANASVLVNFLLQSNGNSGSTSGSATLSDAQEADLMAGKFYANIHSPAPYTGGEIRGQINLTR